MRERAGGFLDLCFTPELAAEVTLRPVRRFGTVAGFPGTHLCPGKAGLAGSIKNGREPRLVLDRNGFTEPG